MAIDTSILTQLKPPPPPKSLEKIEAEQEALAQAQAKRDAVIQQAKDDAAVRAAFGAHSSPDGGVDFDGVLSDVSGKISPSAFQNLQKAVDEHRDKASLSLERELKNQKSKLDAGISLLSMAQDGSSYAALRPSIVALDPVLDEALPPQWDDTTTPKTLARIRQGAMTEKERVDAQHTAAQDLIESKKFDRGTPEALDKARTSLATWLSATASPDEYARDLAAATQMGYPPEVVAMFKGKTAEDAKALAITPEKQAELQGQQATRDAQKARDEETKRHNLKMEARPVAGSGAAAQGVTLSPDAVDYTAAQYRILGPSGIPTRLSDTEKIPIINRAAEQSKALGNSPAQAVQKQAAFKADAGALNQMRKMEASAESFETKANAQAGLISDLSAKVSRTSFPIINSALLAGKSEIAGDTDTQLFYNAVKTFASEYAKIIEGSTGSVAASSEGARRLAESLTPTKLSNGTFQATVKQMQWEMRQTMLGYAATIDHITDRMGGTAGAQTPGASSTAPASQTGGGVVDMVWDPKLGKYVRKGGG